MRTSTGTCRAGQETKPVAASKAGRISAHAALRSTGLSIQVTPRAGMTFLESSASPTPRSGGATCISGVVARASAGGNSRRCSRLRLGYRCRLGSRHSQYAKPTPRTETCPRTSWISTTAGRPGGSRTRSTFRGKPSPAPRRSRSATQAP